MVVSEGSGGDAPPISDTAVRFPIAGADDVQPDWVSRHFDSVYSVAITEDAVYLGGHFQFEPSPTAPSPWPGLTNVGYGTGQGLSGYGLGDDVVRRDHLSAVDPATGHAIEWDPGSNSFQGNKAMLATPRGLFAGGDAGIQGGKSVGRVAFFDFNNDPNAPTAIDTTITTPIEGRVEAGGTPFAITGTATAPTGVKRVQIEIQNRTTKQWLAADGVTWQSKETNALATVASPGATSTTYSLTRTLTGTYPYFVYAKTFGNTGSDASKAVKKIESFDSSDQTPSTNVTGPNSSVISTLTFTMTGTATDDHGVNRLSLLVPGREQRLPAERRHRGARFQHLQRYPGRDRSAERDLVVHVTLPHEGTWRGSATAIDDRRSGGPAQWRPRLAGQHLGGGADRGDHRTGADDAAVHGAGVVVSPGGQLTFSGTAADDSSLQDVEISLRNSTTRENLGADGTWGVNVTAGSYRISPIDINAPTYNWTYTTPFNLTPGTYSFSVSATDNLGLTSSRGSLTINAQVPGDLFPDTHAGRHRHAAEPAGPDAEPDRVGDRRPRRGQRARDGVQQRHRPVRPEQRNAVVDVQHAVRDARRAQRDEHDVLAAGQPGRAGDVQRHRLGVGQRRASRTRPPPGPRRRTSSIPVTCRRRSTRPWVRRSPARPSTRA